MRIGKPESKDNLKLIDIKIGETFRPVILCCSYDENIYMKVQEVSELHGGKKSIFCNTVNLRNGELYSFDVYMNIELVDAYITEVK